jgi:hypothetical protein
MMKCPLNHNEQLSYIINPQIIPTLQEGEEPIPATFIQSQQHALNIEEKVKEDIENIVNVIGIV